jgi:hypothetical protein
VVALVTPAGLRALADAATPGPWKIQPNQAAVFDSEMRRPICSTWGERMYGSNRALIAALGPDAARLLADAMEWIEEAGSVEVAPSFGRDEWRRLVVNRNALLARFSALGKDEA